MSQDDEFRARAAECQRKAQCACNDADKQTWLRIAEAWLLMVHYRQVAEQKLHHAKRELATLQQERGLAQ